jgi:hypothetical protein
LEDLPIDDIAAGFGVCSQAVGATKGRGQLILAAVQRGAERHGVKDGPGGIGGVQRAREQRHERVVGELLKVGGAQAGVADLICVEVGAAEYA